jgi:glycosyltransferase involved in cell wall biosynthesis
MPRKTIGLVAPLPPQVGGVAGFAEWLLANEDEIGCRFDPFDLWRPPEGSVGGRLDMGAVRIQARLLPRFLRWQRTAPKIVHYCVSATATGLSRDLLFLSTLRAGGRQVVGHLQVVPEDAFVRARALRALDPLVERWVTVAPSSARRLAELGIDAAWIPNPIRIAANGDAPAVSANGLRLLFVGRYGERKGCPELVAALARARASDIDATLRFVGREEREGEEAALRSDVAALGLTASVEFAGVKNGPELAACYAEADVLCLPSHREGMPLALLEGMSFGLPVIATPVAGIPDFVHAEENGILVPPGDIEALAGAIATLARDGDLRERLGCAGQRLVREQAGSDVLVRHWREIYDWVAAS